MFYWNDIKRTTVKILAIYGFVEIIWVAKHQIMQQQIEHVHWIVTVGMLILGILASLVVQDMLDEDDILD
jgi:uncharacterized oligopeptide transporter (OPT) family protein